jgi:hypothetical protein
LNDTFYLRHVPQSEYRRLQERKESKEKAYLLDLELNNLGIKDEKLRAVVVELIYSEGRKVIESILPEDLWDEVLNGECFVEIYKKLGLL